MFGVEENIKYKKLARHPHVDGDPEKKDWILTGVYARVDEREDDMLILFF